MSFTPKHGLTVGSCVTTAYEDVEKFARALSSKKPDNMSQLFEAVGKGAVVKGLSLNNFQNAVKL